MLALFLLPAKAPGRLRAKVLDYLAGLASKLIISMRICFLVKSGDESNNIKI